MRLEESVAMMRNKKQPPCEATSKPAKKSNSTNIDITLLLLALKLTAVTLIQATSQPNNATANNFAGQLVLNFSPKSNSSSMSSSHQKSFPINHRMVADIRQDSDVSINARRAQPQNRTGWQIFDSSSQETIFRPQVAVQIFASPVEAPVANRSFSLGRSSSSSISDNSRRYTPTISSKRFNSIQAADHQTGLSSGQWQGQTHGNPSVSGFMSLPARDEITSTSNTRDRRTSPNDNETQSETTKWHRVDEASNKSADFMDLDGNIEFSMNLNGDEIVINPVTSHTLANPVIAQYPQANQVRANLALADLVATASDDEIGVSATNSYNETQRPDKGNRSYRGRRRRLTSRSSGNMDDSVSVTGRQDNRTSKSRRQSIDEDEGANLTDDDYDGEMAAASNSDILDDSLSEASTGSNGLDDESGDQSATSQLTELDDQTELLLRNNQGRRRSRSSPSRSDSTSDGNYEHSEDKFVQDEGEVSKSNAMSNIRAKMAKAKPTSVKKRRLQLTENKMSGDSDPESSHLRRGESGSRRGAPMSRSSKVRGRDGERSISSNDDATNRDEFEDEGRIQRVASSSAPKLVIKGDDLKKFEQLLENLRSLSFAAGVGGAKIQNRARKSSSDEEGDQLNQHPGSRTASTPQRQHQTNGLSNQRVGQVDRKSKTSNSLRDCLRRHDRQDKSAEIILTKESSSVDGETEDDSDTRDSLSWQALGQEGTNKSLSDESQNRYSPSSTEPDNNGESDSSDFTEEQQDASNAVGTRQLQPVRQNPVAERGHDEIPPTPEALFYRKTTLQSYSDYVNRPTFDVKVQDSVDDQHVLGDKSNPKELSPDEQTGQHDYDSQLAQSNVGARASEPKVRNTFIIQDVPLGDNETTRAKSDGQGLSYNQLDGRDVYQSSESRPTSRVGLQL